MGTLSPVAHLVDLMSGLYITLITGPPWAYIPDGGGVVCCGDLSWSLEFVSCLGLSVLSVAVDD